MIIKETEVEIYFPHTLLPWQYKVKNDPHRFKVICAGRRSGKTVLACDELTTEAVNVPNSLSWYVGPTYGSAKDMAWNIMKENVKGLASHDLVSKINDSDLMIELVNGSVVQLKGGDRPELLRGVGLNRLVIDEFAIMKKEVWEEILRPATSDKKAPVIFISTPKGYNHFYDLYQMELKFPRYWKSFHVKTSEAGTISPEELAQAKLDMDERVFKQEFEASFETFGGQVFPSFDRNKVVQKGMKFENDLEFVLGMDFGWSNPTAVLFIQINENEDVFIFDELMATETTIKRTGDNILKREYHRERVERLEVGPFSSLRPYKNLTLNKPDYIYCDPAGDAKSEAMGTSSVYELRKQGFIVKYKKTYPGVIQDGVNTIRKWLQNDKIFIHPKCINLIRAFEMYRYPDPKEDIQSELPLKDGISDHWIDALRYFFLNRFPSRGANWETL